MPKKTGQRHGVEMSRRELALPSTVDVENRSVELTITTETPVRTWIWDADAGCIEADEILVASGLDMSRTPRMPLMDTHAVYDGIGRILGRVDNVRVEGDKVIGTAVFTSRNADLVTDIAEGFYGQVSAGYTVQEYEIEWPEGADAPVARAVRWTLHEASLVPVGADPNASVRGARKFPAPRVRSKNKENRMDIEELISAAEEALAAVDDAVAEAGDDLTEEQAERIRKLRELVDEEEKPEGERKKRKKREEEEELLIEEEEQRGKREDSEDEKKEISEIRSIARSYGLTKTVDDLVKLGARSAQVRAAVRKAVLERGACAVESKASAKGSDVQPSKRSAPESLDTSAIYARRNGRAS